MVHLSRREILAAGLGAAAVGGGIAAGWAWHRGVFEALEDGPAFRPWADWRLGAAQGEMALVAAAILAANPHNSQPWRFRVEPGQVSLRADPRRALGAMDPFRREMDIGLGCALENMMVAARDGGFATTLSLLPTDTADPDLIARLSLVPGPVPKDVDPHWLAIGNRHTHRGAYERDKPVAPSVRAALAACVDDPLTALFLFPAESERGRAFAAATVDATAQIIADETMHQASIAWFRQTREALERHRDGIGIATTGASALDIRVTMALPAVSPQRLGQEWLVATRDVQCPSAALFGVVAARVPRDPGGLLRAGRLWQRLHLEGTLQDVAMQPLNQTMEIADRERQFSRPPLMAERLSAVIGDPGWTAVFGFRAGRAATRPRVSARRAIGDVVDDGLGMFAPKSPSPT